MEASTVRWVDGRRTITLNFILPDDVPLETGVERVKEGLLGAMRSSGELP